MRYRYEGFTALSQVKRGYIDADNPEMAAQELREMGIFTNSIQPDGPLPMKQVLPGGEPMPEPEVSTDVPVGPADPGLGEPGVEGQRGMPHWEMDLRRNLEAIKEVRNLMCSDKEINPSILDLQLPHTTESLINEAIETAIKQAVLRAMKEAAD